MRTTTQPGRLRSGSSLVISTVGSSVKSVGSMDLGAKRSGDDRLRVVVRLVVLLGFIAVACVLWPRGWVGGSDRAEECVDLACCFGVGESLRGFEADAEGLCGLFLLLECDE